MLGYKATQIYGGTSHHATMFPRNDYQEAGGADLQPLVCCVNSIRSSVIIHSRGVRQNRMERLELR